MSGELDIATADELEAAFREALGFGRLVLVDMQEVSFMDGAGLHAIVDAAATARAQGGRVVLTCVPAAVETLLDLTGTRAQLVVVSMGRAPARGHPVRPPDNPVNARIVTARVMAVSEPGLWLQAADGLILRPWSPPSEPVPGPSGTQIDVYLDESGAVNGWHEPESGLAINQRGLGPDELPATYADLTCEGRCGLVWRAPAAHRLAERAERCLTCAGHLALG